MLPRPPPCPKAPALTTGQQLSYSSHKNSCLHLKQPLQAFQMLGPRVRQDPGQRPPPVPSPHTQQRCCLFLGTTFCLGRLEASLQGMG